MEKSYKKCCNLGRCHRWHRINVTGAIAGHFHPVYNFCTFQTFQYCNVLILQCSNIRSRFCIMQSRIRRLIPNGQIERAKITIHSRMDLPLQEVRTCLSLEQFKMLEAQTWLSKYFALEHFEWSGQVVHNLIMRMVGDPNQMG